MGHGGGNKTMPRIAVTVLVLLLVLDATAVSAARSSLLHGLRSLLGSTPKPSTFKVELMHIHNIKSPYIKRNLTLTERVENSVTSSMRFTNLDPEAYVLTSPLVTNHGAYIMQIAVGTPARTFVAIADTGSDLVWLQCSTCTTCLTIPDQPFNPTASSTYSPLSCESQECMDLGSSETPCPVSNICGYNYSYDDKTFTYGQLALETFTLATQAGSTLSLEDTAFGCGTDDESKTLRSVDGLVGLGNGPLSLVSQLGSNIDYVFSYCLVDYNSAVTKTSTLLLGSPGLAPKVYTPLVSNLKNPSAFYIVNLIGIEVNGQKINYPPNTFAIDPTTGLGGIFLDSGTTVTTLFDAAYAPFETAIAAAVTSYSKVNPTGFLSLCYDTSGVSNPDFPTVVFQFDGIAVTLGTSNTFLQVDNKGTYCLAFLSAGPDADFSIYGNIQQSTFEIAYDIGNAQVGFSTLAGQC